MVSLELSEMTIKVFDCHEVSDFRFLRHEHQKSAKGTEHDNKSPRQTVDCQTLLQTADFTTQQLGHHHLVSFSRVLLTLHGVARRIFQIVNTR